MFRATIKHFLITSNQQLNLEAIKQTKHTQLFSMKKVIIVYDKTFLLSCLLIVEPCMFSHASFEAS